MPDLSTVTVPVAPPGGNLLTGDRSAAGFHDVGAAADVPMLEGRRATVEGRRVAIFRLPTGFAATDAECPHRGGPLSDGLVADGCVTCPLHNWRLDLTTGVIGGAGDRMPIHEVAEDGGRLWVRLADGDGVVAAGADADAPCDDAGRTPNAVTRTPDAIADPA
ncbi:MAG: Rieske 2Fe-2S domain-containing protein [Patulibacter sp.]